jgi:hypothetical protein
MQYKMLYIIGSKAVAKVNIFSQELAKNIKTTVAKAHVIS